MLRFEVTISVPHRLKLPLEGGFTTAAANSTLETVIVEVDTVALVAMLGEKAVFSRGGKAVEARGAVTVRHKRKPGEPAPSFYTNPEELK